MECPGPRFHSRIWHVGINMLVINKEAIFAREGLVVAADGAGRWHPFSALWLYVFQHEFPHFSDLSSKRQDIHHHQQQHGVRLLHQRVPLLVRQSLILLCTTASAARITFRITQ